MPTVDCPPERKRTHKSRVLRDIIEMQRVAKEDALTAAKPIERHSAMRAYDVLEERRLMVLGKAGRLSGRVDPNPKPKPKRHDSGWIDPSAQPPGPAQ